MQHEPSSATRPDQVVVAIEASPGDLIPPLGELLTVELQVPPDVDPAAMVQTERHRPDLGQLGHAMTMVVTASMLRSTAAAPVWFGGVRRSRRARRQRALRPARPHRRAWYVSMSRGTT